MNRVEVTGRLTRDPEIRFVGERRFPICTMNVAVEDGEGKWDASLNKRTVDSGFYKVEVVGEYALWLCDLLSKGDQVYVLGSLSQWKQAPRNEGEETKTSTSIKANVVTPLKDLGSNGPPPQRNQPIQPPAAAQPGWDGEEDPF